MLLGGELDDLLSVFGEERVPQGEERIRVHSGREGERALEVLRAPHFLRVEHETQRACRSLHLSPRQRVGGIRCIPEDRHTGHSWNNLFTQLKPLPTEFWRKDAHASSGSFKIVAGATRRRGQL